MLKQTKLFGIFLITLALVIFGLSFSSTITQTQTQSYTGDEIIQLPTGDPTPEPPREFRDGYDMIAESTLLTWARNWVGGEDIIEITNETVDYLPAGYWKSTMGRPDYRNGDPDHPIFFYTVKGKLGTFPLNMSAPSIGPTLPTALPYMTDAYVAIDAISGKLVSWGNASIDDPFANVFYDKREEILEIIATREVEITPMARLPQVERTEEVVPLPTAP